MLVDIPEELEPYLIGLWKFRQVAQQPSWCTTFLVDGAFYDTMPAATPRVALAKAVVELHKAMRNRPGQVSPTSLPGKSRASSR